MSYTKDGMTKTPMDQMAFGLPRLAQVIDVSVPFLRLEVARGRLKVQRLGRRIVVTRENVERYLASADGREV
jgi:hypothetical protein